MSRQLKECIHTDLLLAHHAGLLTSAEYQHIRGWNVHAGAAIAALGLCPPEQSARVFEI